VYHAGSLALHLATVLVVFSILRLLSGNVWAATGGATLFAVHPVQVESVAWASGAKDLLCGLLAVCAIYLYVLYARREEPAIESASPLKKRVYYWAGAVVLVLAMLAKPSAMVVPVIVAAVDGLLIGRAWRKVLWAAGGWAVVVLPLVVVARIAQDAGAVTPVEVWRRPLIAADAVSFYLWKLIWPAGMGPDYGRRPTVVMEIWGGAWQYLIWVVPAAIAVWAWRGRVRRPWVLAGAVVFVAAVGPVLGFTPFMFQYMSTVADHYLYLAMLGPAVGATWLLVRYRQRIAYAGAGLALVALAVRSNVQLAVWHDDPTLWAHTLAACPDSFVAPTNVAAALGREGKVLGRRAEDLREQGDTARAAELDTARRKNYEESVAFLERALAMNPAYTIARHNAFVNCVRLGWHRRAAEHLEAMLAANEGSAEARAKRDAFHETAGDLWVKAGEPARAVGHYELVIARGKGSAEARAKLEVARGRVAEARVE
jgi:hypothetical protein